MESIYNVNYDTKSIIIDNINKNLINTSNKNALNAEEDKQIKENMINMLDIESTKEMIIKFIKDTDYNFTEIEFEKDDDTNGHIKFITYCSNFRAINYSINTVSEFETKGIAGKIIPAIASTTSIISGLVSIELYKLVNSKDYKIENFKNTFLGLGVCFMGSSEPVSCINKKLGNLDITLWTKLQFNDITIQNIINEFNNKYKLNIDQIMYNDKTLYSTFMNENKKQNILNKNISNLIDIFNDKSIFTDATCILNVSVSDYSIDSDENSNNDSNNDIVLVEIKLF